MARYALAYMHVQTTIWGARNLKCTILYTNMLLGARKNVLRFLTLEALVIWENVNIFLFDVKSIRQQDGGAGCILSERNFSQNKG